MKLPNVLGTVSYPAETLSTMKYLADITELVEGSAITTTVKLSVDSGSNVKLLAAITALVKCSVEIVNRREN